MGKTSVMGRLRDRLGKFDDEHVIYSANDPQQRFHWRRFWAAYVAATVLVVALLAVLGTVVDADAARLVLFLATVVFLVAYVIWRRRRNRQLTGSPTRWPAP